MYWLTNLFNNKTTMVNDKVESSIICLRIYQKYLLNYQLAYLMNGDRTKKKKTNKQTNKQKKQNKKRKKSRMW